MYSRYIKYIIYGTPYFLAILHFHCILVWLFCNSCVRSFLPMVLMNVFYFFRICQVSWISFVLKCYYNVFGYPYAHSFITYEHLLYISALLYQYFAQNGNVHKRFRTANAVAMVYLKISTGGGVPGKSLLKPFHKTCFLLYMQLKPWRPCCWFKYLLLRCLYTPMSGLDVKDLIYRI